MPKTNFLPFTEVVIADKKGSPVDKEVQTCSSDLVEMSTQTLPCIIHQAVEEVIEILSDDDAQVKPAEIIQVDFPPTSPSNTEDAEGSVILKITFETILTEPRTYFTNHQKFLECLEEVLSVAPFFKASYFHNYLYIWSTKYYGRWIVDFLETFKYQQYKIISTEYADKPPESSEYLEIKETPIKRTDVELTKIRLIFMVISGMNDRLITNTNYNALIANIRKYTALNENLKNILQNSKIVYTKNNINMIASTSMDHAKKFKELVNSFHGKNFLGLKLSIFDYYVKLKVVGVTFETKIEQLEKVLNICVQNTCLKVCNWFVAEYKDHSIFVYVPRKDADFIRNNPKFILKGKFVIIFEFV